MSRPAGEESLRPAPEPAEVRDSPEIDRESVALALRLAIGKDGLGIELARPATLGCLEVIELVIRLPQVRFPFDVTGGVARFRHRRGVLERLAITVDGRRLARFVEPQVRGVLAVGRTQVTVAPRAFGATVSLLAADGPQPVALAFEVALVALPELALVVHGARGVNLPQPATALALRIVALILGDHARREGARFVVSRVAERLARVLLPDAGVRAPGGADVQLAGSGESDGVLFVSFVRGPENAPPVAELPPAATLASEAALLTRAGDDARFAGDLDRARQLDVATLERAPRHAQVAARIAELDAHRGGRAEAAIAILRAADRASYLGALFADLLVETGDVAGGIATLLKEGERDPSAAVAALLYARAASLASDPADALAWLDRAVARAPGIGELRWERATRRLAQGRLKDARADFQELESLATGARERYAVLRRAADIHRARGLGSEAALLYERALLYRPDDPDTLAGLGAAIASEGRPTRGAALVARAIELAEATVPPRPTAWMELHLARILGDQLGDRPAAVAHLRAVPDEAPEATVARGLEGRYRAALGDAAGATLAFARMRERASGEASAVPWLLEAARFEDSRGELVLAQAHLGVALAIDPKDPAAAAEYRAIGARIAEAAGLRAPLAPSAVVPPAPPVPEPAVAAPAPEPAIPPSPEEDEARVEALTRTLQGDPSNDAVVDELVVRLTRLGRSMELLALLSARLEDAPPERRAELLPRHREVLERLEAEAREAGRDGEAELFRLARDVS